MVNLEFRRRRTMVRRGVFICVEGLDGCGKTTQTKLLVKKLSRDYDAIYTAEPSRGTNRKIHQDTLSPRS